MKDLKKYFNQIDEEFYEDENIRELIKSIQKYEGFEESKSIPKTKLTKPRFKKENSMTSAQTKAILNENVIHSFEIQNYILENIKENTRNTAFVSKKILREHSTIATDTIYNESYHKMLFNVIEEDKEKNNVKLIKKQPSILDQILELVQDYPYISFSDISSNMALFIKKMMRENLDFNETEIMYNVSLGDPKVKKLFEKKYKEDATALLMMFYMCEQTNTYKSILEKSILFREDNPKSKKTLVEIDEENPKAFFYEVLYRATNVNFKDLNKVFSFYKDFFHKLPNYNNARNQKNLSAVIPSYYKISQGLQNMTGYENKDLDEFYSNIDAYYMAESLKEKNKILLKIEKTVFNLNETVDPDIVQLINTIYWQIHNDLDYIKNCGYEDYETVSSVEEKSSKTKTSEKTYSEKDYNILDSKLKTLNKLLDAKKESEKTLKNENKQKSGEISKLEKQILEIQNEKNKQITLLEKEMERISTTSTKIEAIETGEMKVPEITVVWKNLGDLIPGAVPEKMKIKVFTNEKGDILTHKDCAFIPEIDENRIVSIQDIASLFIAWEKKHNSYIWGPTGAGKSTLVEYACALTGRPMIRVNMDSGIDRLHFVGKDTIKSDGTKTWTEFQDGVLLQAMKMPSILLVDEIDFAQPDVLYVLQRVLEGKGLLLMEEGNRFIPAHEEFRLVATANTNGQGDHLAVYRGAKELSIATLDRFATMIKAEYLSVQDETSLLLKQVKGLSKSEAEKIAKLAHEIRVSFTQGESLITLSPRQTLAIADLTVCYSDLKMALKQTLIDRLTPDMYNIIAGLCQRTTGIKLT